MFIPGQESKGSAESCVTQALLTVSEPRSGPSCARVKSVRYGIGSGNVMTQTKALSLYVEIPFSPLPELN